MRTERTYVFVPLESIQYILGEDRATFFYLTNNRVLKTRTAFEYFKSFMHVHGFYAVHRQYLINVHQLKAFDHKSNAFITKTGFVVPTDEEALNELMLKLESGDLQIT